MNSTRGPAAATIHRNDTAGGTFNKLGSGIRQGNKRANRLDHGKDLLCFFAESWHRLNARATGQMARYLGFAAVTVAWFERKEQSPLCGALWTLPGHCATSHLGHYRKSQPRHSFNRDCNLLRNDRRIKRVMLGISEH